MSLRRIWALNLRQLYALRGNWLRLTELIYWPLLNLLLFGFLSVYLGQREGNVKIIGLLLGALILWHIFFQIQQGISVSFLMELWTRNFINLFISPLSIEEFLIAMMLFGLFKIAVTATIMTIMAYLLYHFNIFILGPSLVPFITALIIFGWAVGTAITAVIIRYGQSAETLAWSLAFLFQPFGAIFFPLSVYPEWLKPLLLIFPLPHVFEGMRAVLAGHSPSQANLASAFSLDAIYLILSFMFFRYMFNIARRQGTLLKIQD